MGEVRGEQFRVCGSKPHTKKAARTQQSEDHRRRSGMRTVMTNKGQAEVMWSFCCAFSRLAFERDQQYVLIVIENYYVGMFGCITCV